MPLEIKLPTIKREAEAIAEHEEPQFKHPKGDRKGKGGGKGKGGDRNACDHPVAAVFKVLCPDAYVDALIGRAGAVRIEIEQGSGATLRFSSRGEFYPGTSCRVLTILGEHQTSIQKALFSVSDRLIERGGAELEAGRGLDEAESLVGKEAGEFVFRFAVPKLCAGAIIGTGGANINQLRAETGAKLFIENETYEDHRMARIVGQADSITLAIQKVLESLEEELQGQELVQWAHRLPIGEEVKGKGKGKGKSKRKSKQQDWEEEEADQGWHSEDTPENYASPEDALSAAQALAAEFPEGSLQMEHAISSDFPREKVGALIGKGGEYVKWVLKETGAQVQFTDLPQQKSHQKMTLTGPLCAAYRAHMLMMYRYHEEEMRLQEPPANPTVESLQAQLSELQNQLTMATGAGGGGGKGKGKGKRNGRK